MIWIFNTYIPAPKVRPPVVGAEKVTRRVIFPGHPAYDVLKNPSPAAEKIDSDRPRLFHRHKQKFGFEIACMKLLETTSPQSAMHPSFPDNHFAPAAPPLSPRYWPSLDYTPAPTDISPYLLYYHK